MGLRNGILIRIRKKHIRIGNKFDCVEGVTKGFLDPNPKNHRSNLVQMQDLRRPTDLDQFRWLFDARSERTVPAWFMPYVLLSRCLECYTDTSRNDLQDPSKWTGDITRKSMTLSSVMIHMLRGRWSGRWSFCLYCFMCSKTERIVSNDHAYHSIKLMCCAWIYRDWLLSV